MDTFFHKLHLRFAQRCNRQWSGIGPVYADRPKNFAVKESGLLRLISYIHMNPVRAGVVNRATDSLWSSHHYYMRKAPAPSWLDIESNLHTLGFKDTAAGRHHFDDAIHDIDSASVVEQPHLETFSIEEIEPLDITARKNDETNLEDIAIFVQGLYGLEEHQLTDRHRKAKQRSGRSVFTHIALAEGFTFAAIAIHLNRSRSTIHEISHSAVSE